LFPGTSRSGVTLAAGLMTHLTHRAAARFSFLLGTPIITAAGMLKLAEFLTAPTETYSFNPEQLLLGFMVSFGVGYLAIRMLLAILGRVGLMPFIIYRVILAGILLALFL
ncbi:MAG: undecaprenyl-diphosphate phosphatase, partial [Nitrospinaceae bacterium]